MLFIQSIALLLLSIILVQPAQANSEAYQHAIDQVSAPGTQCWRLQRNPELSAVEYARVRAFCWHRHAPELTRNNSIYNKPVLQGVREQETSAERSTRTERESREAIEQRIAYEAWWQDEKAEKEICLDPTNYGAGDYEWIPGDFQANTYGYCSCRQGLVYMPGGDESFYCTEFNDSLATVQDGDRDLYGSDEEVLLISEDGIEVLQVNVDQL
jgi:hypothetical protein